MEFTKIALLIVLLTVSSQLSAEFFEGFDNNRSAGQADSAEQGQANVTGQSYNAGNSEASGWVRGSSNTDAEVDFSLNFQGKGRTDIASDVYESSGGQTNAYLQGYTDNNGLGYNNLYGYTQSYTGMGNYYPFYNIPYGYFPMPMSYGLPITQAPDFSQIQQQMNALAPANGSAVNHTLAPTN
ncbi:hypothetical protein SAMN05660964_02054 [Thiothrix caldifontis]|uniref:Uncharacterized protein n=1 Tax=Thiothrix caldifontis TaxID=525918 RepID=A0A1H4CRN8_9GAMM|nr:sulfur globule family protein [Thiothrix caldifontis]SEA63050.1 hypothetical protein SAMN05660964_02054 [Thiothrix caldifontis]